MKKIAAFEHGLQEVYEWFHEINRIAGWNDNLKPYAAIRATLHLLRDNLTLDSCVKLSAQLPLLIRGLYFENWRPSDQPLRERTKEEFLENLREILYEYKHPEIDPELAAFAVFKTLIEKISIGSIEGKNKLIAQLPKGIRKFLRQALEETNIA